MNKARSVGNVVIYLSDNEQKEWCFVSLKRGERIYCYQWEVLPASEDVIERVHQMDELELQPKVADNFKSE